jgi:hypothetical protein
LADFYPHVYSQADLWKRCNMFWRLLNAPRSLHSSDKSDDETTSTSRERSYQWI